MKLLFITLNSISNFGCFETFAKSMAIGKIKTEFQIIICIIGKKQMQMTHASGNNI